MRELDLVGTERFELLRQLGAGGMGVVYEARDREGGSRVALKTLRKIDPQALLRFKNEFRALQGLSHPNLVHLGELIESSGQWLLTMELIDGVDFLSYVRAGAAGEPVDPVAAQADTTPLEASALTAATFDDQAVSGARLAGRCDLDRLRTALSQLARGLLALHDAGKTHRDVKPSNVLVTADHRLVLLDFGLITGAGARPERDRSLIGTPAYMAPEQTTGDEATTASDWYAVGVMSYQALTGQLPFRGTVREVVAAKMRFYPPAPDSLDPSVPRDLADLCMALLRRDPEVRPDGRELLARLGETIARGSTSLDLALIGRERELATLDDAFSGVAPSSPMVVRVFGRSGMGKSALVGRFVDRVRQSPDTLVLAGRCYERESLPYKAVDSLVDDVALYLRGLTPAEVGPLVPPDPTALTRVFPVLRGVAGFDVDPGDRSIEPHELRRRMFASFKALLTAVARERRVVIWLDDLQWGDLDSALVLAELVRPPEPPGLLLCVSYRSEEVELSPMLRSLDALSLAGRTRSIEVGPLGPSEARTLVSRLLGPGQRDRVEGVLREAEGVPFFAGELAQYYANAGPGAPEVTITDVVGARVDRLDADAARLLAVIAAFGRPMERALAAGAAGIADPAGAFAALATARLVKGSGKQAEPYHDRIRTAVLAALPADQRHAVASELARRVGARGDADAEILAHLWDAAGEPQRAADYYRQAAIAADGALAFAEAAALYQRAIDVGAPAGADRVRLVNALCEALANAGRTVDAAGKHLEAAELSGGQAGRLHRLRAGELYCLATRRNDGLAVLREVLPAFGVPLPESDGRALRSLLWQRAAVRLGGIDLQPRPEAEPEPEQQQRFDACWRVATGLSTLDPVRAALLYARATRLARASGEPRQVALALTAEVTVSALAGSRSRLATEVRLARARAAAARVDDPYVHGFLGYVTGLSRYLRGDFAGAVPALRAAEQLLRAVPGAFREAASCAWFTIESLQFLGRLAEIAELLPTLRREAERRGDQFFTMVLHLTAGPLFVAMAADRPAIARRRVCAQIEAWGQGPELRQIYEMYALTPLDLYDGDGRGAFDRLQRGWRLARRNHWLRIQITRIHLRLFRALGALSALAAGDRDRALAPLVRDTMRRLAGEGVGYADGYRALLAANLAAIDGDTAATEAALAAAQDHLDGAGLALQATICRWVRGRQRGGDDGAELLEVAGDWLRAQRIAAPHRLAAVWLPALSG